MTTPGQATRLVVRGVELNLNDGPLIMGVVNASPESFSDGGDYRGIDALEQRAMELLDAGAGIIDVGGESGVTGIDPLQPDEEIERVVPLVQRLQDSQAIVSVDTWKPAVARAALHAGAHLINDVSGLLDPALAEVCAGCGAGLVVMHTRARPKHKDFPVYDDVVEDVMSFLGDRLNLATSLGVAPDSTVVDPGPDFAKTPAQTVRVLRHLDRLRGLGRPILLAVSRKDFIGAITDRPPRQREAGTLAAIADGLDRGAGILRVHDVEATVQYLRIRAVLRGERDVPEDLHLPPHLRREPSTG